MFDDVIHQLHRLEKGIRISIDLQLDDDGYLDRLCPNPECAATFKVLFDDWRQKVRDEAVFCPVCRFSTKATDWNTPEQQEYINQAALRHVHQELNDAFTRNARRFNQSQPKGGLIKISMSYRPGPLPILIPADASEIMHQRSICEECGCRYSSVGAAFFCPACGYNSAVSTFDSAVDTVCKTLDALPSIRQALIKAANKDAAENSLRLVRENSLVKLVSAFQRFAEGLFDSLPNRSLFNPRPNVFQNLRESSALWRTAVGYGYEDLLSPSELVTLERFFQQRHLLAHKDGVVDQVYINKTGDNRYAVGQRLTIRDDGLQYLTTLLSKVARGLQKRP
jgi:uncharacterized Zn finger protein (UPF0148 family)